MANKTKSLNSFQTRSNLNLNGKNHEYFALTKLNADKKLKQLPIAHKVLLENMLRFEDDVTVSKEDVNAILNWDAQAKPAHEIQLRPSRVLLQDFTGVPAVVDLAVMRDTMADLGGNPEKINPLQPADLVIDHSVQVDKFGSNSAFAENASIEMERNRERYGFLRWGQGAFKNFNVVPPDTGIIHQINLEYLAQVVFKNETDEGTQIYPDSLVGTDSHTTMINGLGVMGWGVGGIEAEAAMLGQPISMLIPQVVGFKLSGKMAEGTTATDLVLTVVEMLRAEGVVGKFVEFYGDGIAHLSLEDQATIANMAPEYGATMGYFPVNAATLKYLRFSGRDDEQVELVEAYTKAQGMYYEAGVEDAVYSANLALDMSTVLPSISGPKRPQDRIELRQSKTIWERDLEVLRGESKGSVAVTGEDFAMKDGAVVIAAITSCTNTSNPSVLIGAGLLAKKAVELGLNIKPWVKPSLGPGSKVVTEYLDAAGLSPYLDKLKFNLVGYGCTTCIGNSGPLPPAIATAIEDGELVATSVLSGNRNFEGRISPHVKANYLASPPLVVAYALAGTMDFDMYNDALGQDKNGNDVFLKDIWPSSREIADAVAQAVKPEQFKAKYADVFSGDATWQNLDAPKGNTFDWEANSTYIRKPSFFDGMSREFGELSDIQDARVLALLGDSVTTDHISPAGSFTADTPAGKYLIDNGTDVKDFNSYGSRRGNHEVMMRGTFANIRLRNLLAPDTEGGFTKKLPEGNVTTIFDGAMAYKAEGTALVVISGKEYGTGSSRDWAAKGTYLLGVKAVIAESFERIHRSNLIGMGVLPLQFKDGEGRVSLGLTGEEIFSIAGISEGLKPGKELEVKCTRTDGSHFSFMATTRIDTPNELEYYRHGGILQYVMRSLLD
ncbi:MAG: aconitate hydratase AcnA [Candidatus Marinimicrobia bacterium]|jgi:aconitate hydratase|nr:aconitate hydratase AcnA [Candidatus Neomarinimicrobiota bacterium]MBT4714208.1 aconitate hydratase AcnA [Candidatus Neomarinimicrobiota bacterium]MBT4945536.1 aconitate hydratase AcnA [Candidatus Neomarinimicrobiota bacterium]MBT5314180.1 aconitate hydratase AcnA [Candidatus Neomarinimicrobiota bacterium]MBT6011991.1 aconitate hydratase AcnA [Candidatus Neomarinimicrobiota bacterium]